MLDWIWECTRDLQFQTVLDVFGGTASVSLLFKRHGKQVFYNDLLAFNQITARAIIENSFVTVDNDDIAFVLEDSGVGNPDFIQKQFQGVFFLDEENRWLDRIVASIAQLADRYKRSILMASLFQSCLAKRPFNLFHRANLGLRTASVKRTFGNKTTWERPFPELLLRYVSEYNRAIFSNGRLNRVIGGYDALAAPNGVDLVYLDPPYFSATTSRGTNYLLLYSFLEGLAAYEDWGTRIDGSLGKVKRIPDYEEIRHFTRKSQVLSYQDDGLPSKGDMVGLLRDIGKEVRIYEKPYQYALSRDAKTELLFVAT